MKLRYIFLMFVVLLLLLWAYFKFTKNNNMLFNDINYKSIDYDFNKDIDNTNSTPIDGSILENDDDIYKNVENINELEDYASDHNDMDSLHNEANDNNNSKNNEEINELEDVEVVDDVEEVEEVAEIPNENILIAKDEEEIIKSLDRNNLWRVIERKDNYNNELQYYTKENVLLLDNKLVISSKKENKEDKEYTSGLVESNYGYLYGYYEFTIKLSHGKGLFPAIWFMPVEDIAYPEIDVFEMIGSEPEVFYGVIHYLNENNKKSRDYFTKKVKNNDFYKVALEWSEDELIWYIDDEIVYKTSKGISNQYMYLIINQAIGGNWPGEPNKETSFPADFVVENIIINPSNTIQRD